MQLTKRETTEIVKYNPAEIVKKNTDVANFKHVNTLELAIKDDCDSLALINKKVGKSISINIIKIWLVKLNEYLNISRKMNPDQINETADLIYDEFYYLKISDIALLMKRIKTGYYGQFYESIDGMKLMDMFYKYAQERMNTHVSNIDKENNEIKYDPYSNKRFHPDVIERIKLIYNKIMKRQ
jgi:hypothetical protein